MKTLIVEDLSFKQEKIATFLNELNHFSIIDCAHSYSSAINLLNKNQYDLVIVDMSIPSVDRTETEGGGRFRTFGGKDIIRKMKRFGMNMHFVILTQFTYFDDKGEFVSLESIANEIDKFYDNYFLGVIHFDSSNDEWKQQLKLVIDGIIDNA